MSFWLQAVYALLSLTPPDMWGFIVNCTSQAGIPSGSMTVDLIDHIIYLLSNTNHLSTYFVVNHSIIVVSFCSEEREKRNTK